LSCLRVAVTIIAPLCLARFCYILAAPLYGAYEIFATAIICLLIAAPLCRHKERGETSTEFNGTTLSLATLVI